MRRIRNTILVLAIGVLTSCFVQEDQYMQTVEELESVKNELALLKSNLGEFQYQATDPMLEINVRDIEFDEGGVIYSPSAKYRLSIRQTNEDFPLSNYAISIRLLLRDQNDNEIDDFSLFSEIENGVLSLAEEQSFIGLDVYEFAGFDIVAESYNWYPQTVFYPITD